MGKRTYRAIEIKNVDVAKLAGQLSGRVVVGVDIAKEKQFAAFMTEDRECKLIVKWSHPWETKSFVELCVGLASHGLKAEVVMEPSGTYGDAIRAALLNLSFAVFRVSGKRVHDAAEVFDGVPSLHDPKAAVLIALLHLEKKTQPWPLPSDSERELEALRQVMALHRDREEAVLGHIEALTARYWPELTYHLSLTTVTLLEVLACYGGPARVAADIDGARALMSRIGGRFLRDEVVKAVLDSAPSSTGVAMLAGEEALVKEVAGEALHAHRKAAAGEKQLVQKARKDVEPAMAAMVGLVTAATLIASGVAPRKYASPDALEKAFGLNLREQSSGTKKGSLHITKRGDGIARKVLFLAALRLIQTDPVVAAWYRKKVQRDSGGSKLKAVVAVMRKLVKALWHVGRGAPFDATKLFDTHKLGLHNAPATQEKSA